MMARAVLRKQRLLRFSSHWVWRPMQELRAILRVLQSSTRVAVSPANAATPDQTCSHKIRRLFDLLGFRQQLIRIRLNRFNKAVQRSQPRRAVIDIVALLQTAETRPGAELQIRKGIIG